MIREKIKNLIQRAIQKTRQEKKLAKFKIPEIIIERPEEKAHGDYATNVAMIITKQAGKNPMEIANILGSRLQVLGSRIFGKIEMARPGFINFFLSQEYLQEQVGEILKQGEKFGELNLGKNQKVHPVKSRRAGISPKAKLFNRVNVEFISANPTGPLHIGNGRGAFFGDCLANVLEKAGYKAVREYYINDAKMNTQIRTLGRTALGKGITYLSEDLKKKIKKLKPKLKKMRDEGGVGHLLAQEVHKDIRNFIKRKLKIQFNNWVSEEYFYKKSKIKTVYSWLKQKNFIYRKEGADWLKISKFGASKDEVIVRQTGEPTYFLSDIAYHQDKFQRGFQKIINIWGADHQGHVPKMKAAAKMLGYKGDLELLISQIVRLKKGKISKRKGEIVTLEWLVDEVGLDAARFFYLMKSLDTQMEFDVDLAKKRSQKSPVYYVQYAHARICSILKKVPRYKIQDTRYNFLNHPSELALIKELIRFPEIIEDCARDYQIQRIPQYATDLATVFHQFYRDCRVISKDKELTKARLSLILATKTVLKNTLNLMGISAPERM